MLKLFIVLATVAVYNVQANNRVYHLFTRGSSTPQPMTIRDNRLPSNFVPEHKTIILIHGHRGSVNAPSNTIIINELFELRTEYNVIVVDWEREASFGYSVASSYVSTVANNVAGFLRWLAAQTAVEGRVPPTPPAPAVPLVQMKDVHLVGFGLGAHLAGIASRQLNGSPGLVGRITGLDPAGSGWGSRSARLNANDANYVEVIHTDGTGPLANGIGSSIGDIDFYANGGSNQPGCFGHTCSHERAYELFAASFRGHLVGERCSSKTQMNLNLCSSRNTLVMGGTELTKDSSNGGIYRVNTRRTFPF
ncbi:hypothetical protein PYW08_004684 [Mythimna loreyi]|uniref:Uncharacterized protein n=1 Tax=Mythimna loreyi TaxID=667449 RepID=A0ACC2QS82_9NEOP|nr:hypothetical protein PYW08_004684 [Mythimna loreyi]